MNDLDTTPLVANGLALIPTMGFASLLCNARANHIVGYHA